MMSSATTEHGAAEEAVAGLGADLLAVVARLNRYATQRIQMQLPAAQARLLSTIDAHGEARICDLAAMDHCSQPTMTTQVRRLEDAGLVTRTVDPGDARAVRIRITSEGLHTLNQVRADRVKAIEPQLANLKAAERHTLVDAVTVLRGAAKVAKDPGEAAMVQSRIDAVEQVQAARAKAAAYEKEQAEAFAKEQADAQTTVNVAVAAETPKHPTEPATGPKHTATGVIRGVVCSDPSVLEFRLENASGKAGALYNNDFYKIELTVVGFTPKGDINPCTDFEGMKARAQYVESSDKSVDGQVVAVELRK